MEWGQPRPLAARLQERHQGINEPVISFSFLQANAPGYDVWLLIRFFNYGKTI